MSRTFTNREAMTCNRLGRKENVQLFRHASVGLVPVRSEQVKATTALPFNTLVSRESPLAIPAKLGAWVAVILVACHLYPRPGTSPTEYFTVLSELIAQHWKWRFGFVLRTFRQSYCTMITSPSPMTGAGGSA